MIDIHTHILPDVDDGSKDLETSLEMIKIQISQGVKDIVLTPHVQSTVTRASREKHVEQFELLKKAVKAHDLEIELHLGAEILYRAHIDTQFDEYTFGKNKYILLEFPTRTESPIEDVCFDIMHLGYQVILAHVERYQYLSINDIEKIRDTGTLIQVNASSILNLDKQVLKKTVKQLIKRKLIDVVATDAHSLERRPPNLLEAKQYLEKYYDEASLQLLFNRIEL